MSRTRFFRSFSTQLPLKTHLKALGDNKLFPVVVLGTMLASGFVAWKMKAQEVQYDLDSLKRDKEYWKERYEKQLNINRGIQEPPTEEVNPADYVFDTDEVAGYKPQIELLKRELFNSYALGDYKDAYGINQVKGIILYGPPGTGKTNIARAIGKSFGGKTKVVSGPELKSKWIGQSEESLRKVFEPAVKDWKEKGKNSPLHVIVIDEIDVMCPHRSNRSDDPSIKLDNSMTTQLLTILDGVDSPKNVIVIGTTNRPDNLDPALLRSGRLEIHMEIDYPNLEDRNAILELKTRALRNNNLLDGDVDLMQYAKQTPQFTGADLECLVRVATLTASKTNLNSEAHRVVLNSNIQSVADLAKVGKKHFDSAFKEVAAIRADAKARELQYQKSINQQESSTSSLMRKQ